MSEDLKKEKISFEELGSIAGGIAVDVLPEAKCCKPGKFMVLDSKREEWEAEGRPEKCKNCWYLMHDFRDGYICKA